MAVNRDNMLNYIALFAIIALGIAARLYDVTYNFDGDELSSVALAGKSFSALFNNWPHTAHPPLHILLLHFWMKIFGYSEVAARSLSILASGLFLLAAHRLLRHFVSDRLALGLLLLLAISPLFVYFGQQARPFSFVALFTVLNMLAFMRVFESPTVLKRTVYWFATCTLLIYTQYQAVALITIECILILVFLKGHRTRLISWAVASIATIMPWIFFSLGPAVSRGDNPMPNISWIQVPTVNEYFWFYVSIFGLVPGIQVRWLLFALSFLGLAYLRQIYVAKRIPPVHLFIIMAGLGLVSVVFIVSVWGPKPAFAYRHLIGAAFACIAFFGLCLNSMSQRYAAGAIFFLLIWTAAALPSSLPHDIKPPWREVASYIDEKYDVISVFVPEIWIKNPLAYYRQTGPVELWDSVNINHTKHQEFLFVCRPRRCEEISTHFSGHQISLEASWTWGRNRAESKKLELFKITIFR